MKRFLYAIMAVSSLVITSCGQKKEAVSAPEKTKVCAAPDYLDQELLDELNAIEAENEANALEDAIDDEEDDIEEDENELIDELADDEAEADALEALRAEEEAFKGMSPEEIAEAERQIMAELAELIARQQEQGGTMAAVGPDQFNTAFDLEKMTEQERNELLAWHNNAEEWAQHELMLAKDESEAEGFKPMMFAKHSTDLLPSQSDVIADNVKFAKAAIEQGRVLVVTAHAEADAEDPMALSTERAEIIKNTLVAAGVDAEALHTAGYGASLLELFDAGAASTSQLIVC